MSAPTHEPRAVDDSDALVQRLRRGLDETLAPLIPRDRPVALLDFPVYGNVGDSAIWLGELATLRRLGVPEPDYVCSFKTWSRRELQKRIGNGTILLSGGGNFGDRYRSHQRLREEVISTFSNSPIIQLPQSIWYSSPDNIASTRRVLSSHPRLTLLLRDRMSMDFAAREFPEVRATLCTDMALGLDLPRAKPRPDGRVLWLSRDDIECGVANPVETPPGVERVDWVEDGPFPMGWIADRIRRRIRNDRRLMRWFYGPVARQRLSRGVALLRGARSVVTDRLHAHVVCLLLGIPHVLLPNLNGKVRSFYDTWTHSSPLVRWCDDVPEALQMALESPDPRGR